jgi:hypothetical protein
MDYSRFPISVEFEADLATRDTSSTILDWVQRLMSDMITDGPLADALRNATARGGAPLVDGLRRFATACEEPTILRIADLVAGAERRIASIMGIGSATTALLIAKRADDAQGRLRIELDHPAVLRAGIAVVNDILSTAGLHGATPGTQQQARGPSIASAAQELSMLRKIRVEDNKENWFKGNAEIFALISGFGADGQPFVKSRPMLFLAKSKVDYTPNMDLVNWAECSAPYVNVQLFDKDGDTDFQQLATGLVKAVGEGLKLSPTTAPYAAVAEIGDAILNAMDGSWFKNSPDYVDSIYVLERGKTYSDHKGAANNCTFSVEPYTAGA